MVFTEIRKGPDVGNIATWIKSAEIEAGEQIEAAVVGRHYNRRWDDASTLADENVILSRDAALAKLDEEYDAGFGGADCFPMYAWSPSWVFYVHEYDGATSLNRLPRNPVACEPDF